MTKDEITKKLRSKVFGQAVHYYQRLESTNSMARILADQSNEGTIVIAEEQTAGRGRRGRSWISESGENLTFSVILKPHIGLPHLGIVSLYACLSVAEAIESITGKRPEVKWPNDVLVDGMKCCGILSESIIDGGTKTTIITGIGLNVNQSAFPGELTHSATSLLLAASTRFDRADVLVAILERMEKWYTFVQTQQYEVIRSAWLNYATFIGKQVSITDGSETIAGIAVTVERNGELVLSQNGVNRRFAVGDLTLRVQS